MFLNKKIKQYLLSLIILTIGLVFVPTEVYAQVTGTDFGVSNIATSTELGGGSLIGIVSNIINVALGLLGIVAVSFFLYGGFVYMTAGGNEDKVEKAKKIILNSVIGIAIILSSFAIARFVITSLSDATGTGTTNNGSNNITSPPPNNFGNGCGWNPGQGYKEFFVHSITPSTDKGSDSTHMNNVTVRVVFSRALGSLNKNPITVKKNGNNIPVKYSLEHDNRVIEVNLKNGGDFSTGTYSINVDESIKDATGKKLQKEQKCNGKDYPINSTFTIDKTKEDKTKPQITNFTLDGSSPAKSNKIITYQNDKLSVGFSVDDRTSTTDFGGNSFVRVRVYPKGAPGNETIDNFYMGPNIEKGSSPIFSDNYEFWLNDNFSTSTKNYVVELRAYDIDGNYSQSSGQFVMYPNHCSNGKKDKDEKGIDVGGSCGKTQGASCKSDSDCSGYMQCVSGSCQPKAVITDVSPWKAGEGSLVSIYGNYFGDSQGSSTIQFGTDSNKDNVINNSDDWIDAKLPSQCQGFDVWDNNSIIVQVPEDKKIPPNTKAAIRFVKDKYKLAAPTENTHIDSTNDNYGPSQWEIITESSTEKINGLFEKNNNKLPGLCSVEDSRGAKAGLSGDKVKAIGSGFTASKNKTKVLFSEQDIQGLITSIPNKQNIELEVPQMSYGQTSVKVSVDGRESNSVLFDIITTSSERIPTLKSISPSSTTKGSFATISGSNFGDKKKNGEVWAHKDQNKLTDSCFSKSKDSGCVRLLANLPNYCGDTWKDENIIVEIPEYRLPNGKEKYPTGTYHIAVKNRFGEVTDGLDTIRIKSGAAKPSICNITPTRGNAPLGDEVKNNVTPLVIKGANFGKNPVLYFWKNGANSKKLSTWFKDSDYKQRASAISSASSTEITTYLPESDTSMETGPIVVKSSGIKSNSVQYEVRDCRQATQSQKNSIKSSGYRCCTTGPEAGTWKDKQSMCKGENRTSGYNWRFSSAEIPVIPRVVEYCDPNNYPPKSLPSPTPRPKKNSNISEGKENICINASVEVGFSTNIEKGSVGPGSVELIKCNKGGSDIDCSSSSTIPLNNKGDLTWSGDRLTIFRNTNKGNLDKNTWYRVKLFDSIQSITTTIVNGNKINNSYSLQKTRPCGENTSYCFDFKTSDDSCAIKDAFVNPSSYVAEKLGPLKTDSGYRLYYKAYGIPYEQCAVVPTSKWGWNSEFKNGKSAKNVIDIKPSSTDKAEVNIKQNSNKIIDIIASTTVSITGGHRKTVTGTSELYINLGDPKLSAFWPACTNSCTNAEIGARFNRPMLTSTFKGNINLYECSNENCDSVKLKPVNYNIISKDEVTFRPKNNLTTNTPYLVKFNKKIKAIQGYDKNGAPIPGKSIQDSDGNKGVSWKFVTKNNNLGCTIDRVEVKPNRNVSRIVGSKTSYRSVPFGAPNSCSPQKGQRLNPVSFDWSWLSVDTKVATTTNYKFSKDIAPTCNISTCLPSGSDILSNSNNQIPLCGNGVVEDGEDCDIAAKTPFGDQEVAGVSCNYNCLRPGSTSTAKNKAKGGKYCGDGDVQPEIGEECDIDGSNLEYIDSGGNRVSVDLSKNRLKPEKYCSDTCTNKGVDLGDTSGSICDGSGVSYGEDCEKSTDSNCSERCLNTGTSLSQSWCAKGSSKSELKDLKVCKNSISVCRNGVLEPSEQCEIDNNNLIYRKRPGSPGNATGSIKLKNPENHCTNKCVFQNLCTGSNSKNPKQLNNIPSVGKNNVADLGEFRCDPNEEGCNDDCTIAGSSINYSISSACGDTDAGIGEYKLCEAPNSSDLLGSHVQVITSVGKKDTTSSVQSTTIKATAEKEVKNAKVSKTGEGRYYLQCGFEEYEDPSKHNGEYNNCPKSSKDYGVGNNSCCYPRKTRSLEYPKDGDTNICRNTLIEVEFGDTKIDNSTVNGNSILVARGTTSNSCGGGEKEITSITKNIFALETTQKNKTDNKNWFVRAWDFVKDKAKNLFSKIFNKTVNASTGTFQTKTIANNRTWCIGGLEYDTSVDVDTVKDKKGSRKSTSTISVSIKETLASNTYYAVILKSGKDGIKDQSGVGIKPKSYDSKNIHDGWIFKTGAKICTVNDTQITPSSYRYSRPNSSTKFTTEAISGNQQKLTPIKGVYDWKYSWGPSDSKVFGIPKNHSSSTIMVSSTNQEGAEKLRSEVEIVTAISGISKRNKNDKFVSRADMFSLFCQRPWPGDSNRVNNEIGWEPYENTTYNFSSYYCASAGRPDSVVDDLPLFDKKPNKSTTTTVPGGSAEMLEKWLFFNDKKFNNDVIGIQIFKNPKRKDIRDWYSDNFSDSSSFSELQIDGYKAIKNDTNYYINALNVDSKGSNINNVYNNIYHFSINEQANEKTRKAFSEFINNLDFHTNIPDPNYCLDKNGDVRKDPEDNIIDKPRFACSNDFDCRNNHGYPLINGRTEILNKTEEILNSDYIDEAPKTTVTKLKEIRKELSSTVTNTQDFVKKATTKNLLNQIQSNNKNTKNKELKDNIDQLTNMSLEITAGVCGNAEEKLKRDWNRFHEIRKLQSGLKNQLPKLQSGTYYPGYTTNKWPSWDRFIRNLPGVNGNIEDEVSRWSVCGNSNADPTTCWDPKQSTYYCPRFAQVYEYSFNSNNDNYTLYTPLEYFELSDGITNEFLDTSNNKIKTGNKNRWCKPGDVKSPLGGTCGNGIVESGEKCDPPGKKQTVSCGVDKVEDEVCASDCSQWETVQNTCRDEYQCGNGIVDPGEDCDDGNQNGEYGHCTTACENPATTSNLQGKTAGYCGDGKINRDQNNNPFEVCEDVSDVCQNIKNKNIKPEIQILFNKTGYISRSSDWGDFKQELDPLLAHKPFNIDNSFLKDVVNIAFDFYTNGSWTSSPVREVKYHANNHSERTLPLSISGQGGNDCTADALQEMLENYNNVYSDENTRKILFLVHHGGLSNSGCSIENNISNVKDKIRELAEKGIETAVIGVGRFYSIENLRGMAEASPMKAGSQDFYNFSHGSRNIKSLEGIFRDVLSCDSYSFTSFGSCSADCQSIAGYCGDGVQNGSEDCDDGNNNNSDSCPNSCMLSTKKKKEQSGPASCGNGILEKENGEMCDKGENNRYSCDPDYGRSCTYCHADTCKIKTRDAKAYCGNGIIDKINEEQGYEACEVVGDEKIITERDKCSVKTTFTETNKSGDELVRQQWISIDVPTCSQCNADTINKRSNEIINKAKGKLGSSQKFGRIYTGDKNQWVSCDEAEPKQCSDKGEYYCNQSCNGVTSDCVECLKYKGKDSVPYIATINPLIAATEKQYYSQGDSKKKWGAGKGDQGFREYDQYVVSYRNNPPENKSTDLKVPVDWGPRLGYTKLSRQPKNGNLTGNINPTKYKPLWANFDKGRVVDDWSLESNLLCKGEYQLKFSPAYTDKGSDYKGDIFNYSVNGPNGDIRNSYITSPAVPEKSYRVVVRWKGDNFWGVSSNRRGPGKFAGNFYGQSMAQSNNSDQAKITYSESVQKRSSGGLQNICTDMKVDNEGYWTPTGPSCRDNAEYRIGKNNLVQPHFIGNIKEKGDLSIQSYTILNSGSNNAAASLDNDDKIGFYVTTVGDSTIQQHQNKDIEVLIYEYQKGQVPTHSIYKPEIRFEIKESEKSNFKKAKFWHVFNFVKNKDGSLRVEDINGKVLDGDTTDYYHGIIKTRFPDVKNNIDSDIPYGL